MGMLKVERSEVGEFYTDRCVFITGGTGFMGKVLVEKLLYSCSDVKKIYLLMRPKRGQSIEDRLEQMFNLPMFLRIRNHKPEVFQKIVPVFGDICREELGIVPEARKILEEEVSVVFHLAATLKLEANLHDAISMNTEGTKRMIQLAKGMKKLVAFVHSSTAFCHCDLKVMEEKVYPSPEDPDNIMNLASWLDVETMDILTPKLIHPHPNTYTYTKRLAESLVAREHPNLPVCIARPSIVTPAWREPLAGWVDNLNGPTGILVAGSKGVIRTMLCNGDYHAEVIPVDMAINGLIVVGYKVGTSPRISEETSESIPVYNLTQCGMKPITWREVLDKGKKLGHENPFSLMLWYPDGTIRTNRFTHQLCIIFTHWLPAYLIDGLLLIFGQKRFMIRVQTKISQGLELLQYFTMREWLFKNTKLVNLRESLSPYDKKTFSLEFEKVDQIPYMRNCILGARHYCMKEDPKTLPRSRRILKIMYILHKVMGSLFYVFIGWLIVSNSETARQFLNKTKDAVTVLPFFRTRDMIK
uniref:Fatty acyl-CoA reductase n=1 Tax=Cacopsylla melanoneura TaxID=428564 RepID=A0A8D8T7M0_9HEMI